MKILVEVEILVNKYGDILDSWITIEQFTEGTINKKDRAIQQLFKKEQDWKSYFLNYIKKQGSYGKNPGIVFYFGIFEFKEVIEYFCTTYKIQLNDENVTNSEKFSIAIYFDDYMNIEVEKLFLTISGYIKEHKVFPMDFTKIENEVKDQLAIKFNTDFNKAFNELMLKYGSLKAFRYKYLSDIENMDANLHSFFIEDLTKAKKINQDNLNRYLSGFSGNRINLDSNKNSSNFNPRIFEEGVLQPKLYPLGRFLGDVEHKSSFMQQVAINLSLNDSNNIMSVNGPPGTGKTTLLKEIFADLIVKQAIDITKMKSKEIERDVVYFKSGKFGFLPNVISEKNIVVASSNNGAVQNIVDDLPKLKGLSNEVSEEILNVDYFTEIANEESEKSKLNWGVFSLEGGKNSNIKKLMSTIEMMVLELKDNYINDGNVYEEFNEILFKVERYKENMQGLFEKNIKLGELKRDYSEREKKFNEEKHNLEGKLTSDLEHINYEEIKNENKINDIDLMIGDLEIEEQNQLELNDLSKKKLMLLETNKSSFYAFKKIFSRKIIRNYLNSVSEQLELVAHETKLIHDIKNSKRERNKELLTCEKTLNKLNTTKKELIAKFEKWETQQIRLLNKIDNQITSITNELQSSGIEVIDLSVSYEELQNSNPWYGDEFRELQMQLFMAALKVRKQFLYENYKSLKAAVLVWKNQEQQLSKDNGYELINESWHWINFAIPVIGTTFASLSKMFKYMNENSIGHLFIDEAGQALPQSSIGGIFRSNKVVVVGDPEQIKPVLPLDPKVLNIIAKKYNVDEKFISESASTQTIVDDTSQFGFYKEDDWIGIPLWVHRRCDNPMFSISNKISYNGLMVLPPKKKSSGISKWYDITGVAKEKYVHEQGEKLKEEIKGIIENNPLKKSNIYVITPFKNVAQKLVKTLEEIDFPIKENNKVVNIGTVHTFQGKEADIVFLVLGADMSSKGAANWAVEQPNIINVAATRAKKELYIIGDKKLYSSLGSSVANNTMKIIEAYNK